MLESNLHSSSDCVARHGLQASVIEGEGEGGEDDVATKKRKRQRKHRKRKESIARQLNDLKWKVISK